MDHRNNIGSVAYLKNIKHAVSVARAVMERSRHVMLVGDGAYDFAIENGFKHQNLLTSQSKEDWQSWLKEKDPKQISDRNHDTITQLSIDTIGNLAGASTTSGLAYKRKGRVGDSPLIGSGLYVDNEIGAAGGTGIGEEIVRCVGSFFIVDLMGKGFDPTAACEEAIKKVLKNNQNKNVDFQVAFVALRKDGAVGASCLNKGFYYNVATKDSFDTVQVKGLLE